MIMLIVPALAIKGEYIPRQIDLHSLTQLLLPTITIATITGASPSLPEPQPEKYTPDIYCTILINSAHTVTCDRPRALDGFVNAAKPRDIGRKIAKKSSKNVTICPFGTNIRSMVSAFEIVTRSMCDISSILEGL